MVSKKHVVLFFELYFLFIFLKIRFLDLFCNKNLIINVLKNIK